MGEFNCPRRSETGVQYAAEGEPPYDTWRENHTCSYCGSMKPEKLFELIEAGGCELGPTDKNYKAYVNHADPDAEKPRIIGSANFTQTGDDWLQITEENQKTLPTNRPKDYAVGSWVMIGPTNVIKSSKFYFQHFDDAQQERFIDLFNAKKLNIGYPNYFYNPPFFCGVKKNGV